jgi:Na+/melibiose symporter-like transporter
VAFEHPRTRRSDRDHILLSCFWFAYNFEWGALLPVVLPSQIAAIVGDARKEIFNGLVPAAGAALSLVATPIAGALSDRSRNRIGRRRPFLAVGTAINILFLLLLARFGAGGSIGLFLLCYLGVQLGANWAGGPYAGLIPDLVPPKQRGQASGWLALMTAAGTLCGVIAAGALIVGRGYGSIYLAIAVTLAALCAVTFFGVTEKPLVDAPAPIRAREFAASFLLRGPRYRDFYFVLFTRALVTMGIYSVFTFFQFFLKDVVRSESPARDASYLVGIIIAAGIPTSLLAGALSDHLGRKPMVYVSGGLMAVASLLFIGVGRFPSLAAMYWIGAIFGIGYGAYQAVDWALAIDVLPQGDSAAKDMGIWHVSLVLPQVLAPALTGVVLSAFKQSSLLLGYTVVFILTALWFILGTVFVRQIRSVR